MWKVWNSPPKIGEFGVECVRPRFRTFGAMVARYPKNEKLKSRKTIGALFAGGKSVTKFPLRLVYLPIEEAPTQVAVSVSKKFFKRAVDRNYYKRLLREAYRKNKAQLIDGLSPHAFMIVYQTRERLTAAEVESKMQALFDKFHRAKPASDHNPDPAHT